MKLRCLKCGTVNEGATQKSICGKCGEVIGVGGKG